jgi:hypothetical protein
MDAVTYPDPRVFDFIEKRMIPVRVAFNDQPLATDFNVKWTPTLITLDTQGKEHHRTLGFLSPEELIPSLLLGMAKCHFDLDETEEALKPLNAILQDYPQSDAAPEAVYLRGVSTYKNTRNAAPLKEAYELLKDRYPSSQWTKRAYPYRLL